MKNYSMTSRLIFSFTATLIAFWLVAVAAGVVVMQDEFGEIFDSSLKETAERLTPLVVDDILQSKGTTDPRRLQNIASSPDASYLTYQVRDATGGVILHSHDISPKPFAAPLKQGFWEDGSSHYYTVPAVNDTVFVQVADAKAHRDEAVVEGGLALLFPLLVLIPVGVLVVRLVVRRSIVPVNDLRHAIAGKDGGSLAPIRQIALPRELQPIVHSVNRLLARLRSTLAAEREFTSNSAHELRTPIAGALAQTQLLKKEIHGENAKSRVFHIELSLQKLSRLVEKLMQLARAEAGLESTRQLVDLAHVLDLIVSDFQSSDAAAARIQYFREKDAELKRNINEDVFAIALRNLIENALKHGNQEEPIVIRLEDCGIIRIANGGSVLGQEEIKRIQKRFGRGETPSAGSGLGLSIVTELVSQMDANLSLRSPATNREDGFEAVLQFNAKQ
jgi:two-component system, OmpR family, sensor kinase